MSRKITNEVKRRLRLQLDDEKAIFEAKRQQALAAIDGDAALAEKNALAVAASEAADNQRRIDADNMRWLEQFTNNGMGDGDIGTPAERAAAMAATGVTENAICLAASGHRGSLTSDNGSVVVDGVRRYPEERWCNAVAALIGKHRRMMSEADRAEAERASAEREAALRAIAQERIDAGQREYAAQLAAESAMEDR